jgi:hypothetical protein
MRVWLCGSIALVCACAGAPPRTYSATFTDRDIRIESYAKSFRSAEPALLANLASETRMLARMTPKPTVDQIASRDDVPFGAGVWLARGFIDPFLFSDRETALSRVRSTFETAALPDDPALRAEALGMRVMGADAGDRPGMPRRMGPPAHLEPLFVQLRLEQGAFRRFFEAEAARLERERRLPKAAADLVRALVLAWPLMPGSGELQNVESMVSWRLQNLDEALGPNTLSAAERDDLRDALSELAPRVTRMPKVTAELVKLTKTLDAMWVTPFALEDEREMDQDVTLFVGAPLPFDALDGAFESAARAFETQATSGLSVLDGQAGERVRERAKHVLFAAPACLPRSPVHSPLDLAPPDERAWSCSLLHALDETKTEEAEIAADLAWHDAIVVAQWAVSTHGPVRSEAAARAHAKLMLPLSAAESARLMGLAKARPMRAIAVGVAAAIVMKDGAAHAQARAHHWRGIGDAPMDLIAAALAPR